MSLSLFLSMTAFALATSLSPGPVNIVALSSGATHGLRLALRHAVGAAAGLTLLLVVMGAGLHEAVARWPMLTEAVRLAGVAFLLHMSWQLARASGTVDGNRGANRPSALTGAIMQWLSPKAWMACIAGMGAYATGDDIMVIAWFAAIYFIIAALSIGAWAAAGSALGRALQSPHPLRLLNQSMAALLAASALYLLLP